VASRLSRRGRIWAKSRLAHVRAGEISTHSLVVLSRTRSAGGDVRGGASLERMMPSRVSSGLLVRPPFHTSPMAIAPRVVLGPNHHTSPSFVRIRTSSASLFGRPFRSLLAAHWVVVSFLSSMSFFLPRVLPCRGRGTCPRRISASRGRPACGRKVVCDGDRNLSLGSKRERGGGGDRIDVGEDGWTGELALRSSGRGA